MVSPRHGDQSAACERLALARLTAIRLHPGEVTRRPFAVMSRRATSHGATVGPRRSQPLLGRRLPPGRPGACPPESNGPGSRAQERPLIVPCSRPRSREMPPPPPALVGPDRRIPLAVPLSPHRPPTAEIGRVRFLAPPTPPLRKPGESEGRGPTLGIHARSSLGSSDTRRSPHRR